MEHLKIDLKNSLNSISSQEMSYKLCFHKNSIIKALNQRLIAGKYQYGIVKLIENKGSGHKISLWNLTDRIVNKAISSYLNSSVRSFYQKNAYSIKGHGGLPKIHNTLKDKLFNYKFFYRTDVKSYYASIDHRMLIAIITKQLGHNPLIKILWRCLRHRQEINGRVEICRKGVCRGGSLSPVFGNIYLTYCDKFFSEHYPNVRYMRYMDDILLLSDDQKELDAAKQDLLLQLKRLKLEIRPEKTQEGSVEDGFEFLGMRYAKQENEKVGIVDFAAKTKKRMQNNLIKYYKTNKVLTKDSLYVKHFSSWAKGVSNKFFKNLLEKIGKCIAQVLNEFKEFTFCKIQQ